MDLRLQQRVRQNQWNRVPTEHWACCQFQVGCQVTFRGLVKFLVDDSENSKMILLNMVVFSDVTCFPLNDMLFEVGFCPVFC